MLGEDVSCSRVNQPGIERYRGDSNVIPPMVGVLRELAVIDVAVGRPVQIGVVEQKAGPGRRKPPTLRAGDAASQLNDRQDP